MNDAAGDAAPHPDNRAGARGGPTVTDAVATVAAIDGAAVEGASDPGPRTGAAQPAAGDDPFAGLGPPDPTGSDPVDAALDRLADVPARPVGEHAGVYESVHTVLRDTLARLDA